MLSDLLVDTTACEREPIHIPGAVQPHGIMLAVSAGDFRITAVSANASLYCGRDARDLLQTPLSNILTEASFNAVAAADCLVTGESHRLARLHLSGSQTLSWRAVIHPGVGGAMLEAELLRPEADVADLDHFERFQHASQRLMTSADVTTTNQRLVEEVRLLTGYSRVMMYRFAPDWSGEVIAEASDDQMPSYFGLHFPASDIPEQARALYAQTAERQIPDVGYKAVPLIQSSPVPLDLSQVGLRSVSPVHLTYLRNMGVGASMSISLLVGGQLWGLVACHHPVARFVSPEQRQLCVLLAQIAVARWGLLDDAEVARRNVAVKAVEAKLLHDTSDDADDVDRPLNDRFLSRNGNELLDLLGATGLALKSNGTVMILGKVPAAPVLNRFLGWLDTSELELTEHKLLVTDHLAEHYPAGADLPEAAGILAVPLGRTCESFIVWFRPAVARTIIWAGDPIKPVESGSGRDTLTPRRSFAAWAMQVQGRSRAWTKSDIAIASSLRDTLVNIFVHRSAAIERMNARLRRSNEELEAFAYIASHDLKEPLRQIEIFASLLRRASVRPGDSAEKTERWFSGISTSSRRLRYLIDHLANYARLGNETPLLAPADLGEILSAVLQDFAGQIGYDDGIVAFTSLPVVMCDATQMRQVLQNLIGNAIKYRHPDRLLAVRVSAEPLTAPDNFHPTDLPKLVLRFEDNGIGFEGQHSETIFRPFERLHSAQAYDGSGLGLAICRKVIARHGGTITATGRPGEGAVFTVTMPLRTLPGQGGPPE